jgi:L,D-peptidoglycan transpeptidase YkuD (ErfK/YbiS/YcfS/YnhG family)
MHPRFAFLVFVMALSFYGCERNPIYLSNKWGCKQLLVVKTASMDSIQGQLFAYEWSEGKKEWQIASQAIPMVVGYKGLAWGDGLQDSRFNQKPFKKEGDRKSPIGIFFMSSLFGYDAAEHLGAFKMPFLKADSSIYCVDDPQSSHYNQIVDADVVKKDWQSAEQMLMDSDLYKYGVVIDYNFPKAEKDKGSCIFIHVWRNAQEGTFGCTAVEENAMKHILLWLDKSKKPILVQAPEKEYQLLKQKYFLP